MGDYKMDPGAVTAKASEDSFVAPHALPTEREEKDQREGKPRRDINRHSTPPIRSQFDESTSLRQENRTRRLDQRFSAIISRSKDNGDRRSRTLRLSDSGSAAERRRTYNGTTSTTDLINKSRFSTASIRSLDTYCTATSSLGSWHTAPSIAGSDAKQGSSTIRRTFRRLLQRSGLSSLVEVEQDEEFDWCGRGMHVDFDPGERIPLEICDSAGHGSTSTVDIVKCRRVKLARKLTYLTRRVTQKEVLKEVQALQKLKHAHVVQLIGTYRQGRKFAALLYPVADMDLAQYLEDARYMLDAKDDWLGTSDHERAHQDVLSKGSLCLVSALRYVHESGVKHMDIKPANILLKKYEPTDAYFNNIAYKIYLCDFGIAQVFNADDQSQTETYPGKTPTYASPEVAAEELQPHGRASDIFSLGCVLAEMATVYSGLTVESLKTIHLFNKPYHKNVESLRSWITTLEDMKVTREIILKMLHEQPEDRASLIKRDGGTNIIDLECSHHHDPPDLFEADDDPQYLTAEEPHVAEEVRAEKPLAVAPPILANRALKLLEPTVTPVTLEGVVNNTRISTSITCNAGKSSTIASRATGFV